MKICTACNTTYQDETLSFCPVDGTTLTPQKNISFEQVPFSYETGSWSNTEPMTEDSDGTASFSNPEPPPTAASSFPTTPTYAPQNYSVPPRKSSSNPNSMHIIIIAAVVVLGAIVAFVMAVSREKSRTGVSYSVANSNTATIVNRTTAVTKPAAANVFNSNASGYTNAAPAANTAVSTNVNGKPIPRTTDFTGIWTGEFNEEPTVLSITTQKGDSFSGTLSKEGYIVKITGQIDYEKGTVKIKETKVLQTPPNRNWFLGTNDGTISEGGKAMSGTGSDKNSSYEWSFTKE